MQPLSLRQKRKHDTDMSHTSETGGSKSRTRTPQPLGAAATLPPVSNLHGGSGGHSPLQKGSLRSESAPLMVNRESSGIRAEDFQSDDDK